MNLLINALIQRRRWRGVRCSLLWSLALLMWTGGVAAAADLEEAQQQFLSGNYSACIATAKAGLRDSPRDEDWHVLLSRALLATGQYPQAYAAMTNALEQNPWGIQLRWQARQVFLSNGRTRDAARMLQEIIRLVGQSPGEYRDAASLVVFGQTALLAGADPKRVLDTLYGTAKKADPKLRDVYLASGELALDKHDFARAATEFNDGLKQLPDDPDLNFGLARAYAESDQALMLASLEAALKRNSNHVGSLLLLADHCIDAEDYARADKLLDQVNAVNPWNPDSWAYRAVLAHLRNQPQAERDDEAKALKFWPTNPRVEFLIGEKLSQKYLFAEGAAHQRKALDFDRDYLPAKIQLAQDLLRLGDETEGWQLAQEVQKEDGYDVEAFNLSNLHDEMEKFATLTNADFRVRMSKQEAELYGSRVLELLSQARSNLCAKYGLNLTEPTTVEIFPAQSQFAVRTFGMPGNPGYLGVCFGSVITANSPESQKAHPVNWEDVLWHEFCHVVTLHITRNKMPRWLSEGISVYEERQANPAWGEHMNPQYRGMILGDDLTPISKLSGAFLTPRSGEYLQFAYYESSLVVEFIVQRFGMDNLKAILRDLGEGNEINTTTAKHSEPMAQLEKDFAAYARGQAEKLAPGLDWTKPSLIVSGAASGRQRGRRTPLDVPIRVAPSRTNLSYYTTQPEEHAESWDDWAKRHPTNYWVMTQKAGDLVEEKNWQEAKPLLQTLIQLYPNDTGEDSPYRYLAAVYRALGETNEEQKVLTEFAARDTEAPDVYLRLMQMNAAEKDWPAVLQNANRYLAVNPLVAPPYRFLAQASEQTGNLATAIEAYRALLQLDPADPVDVHYRLAEALYRTHNSEARRQVLEALEDAPRYRAALKLLLQINGEWPQPAQPPAASNSTSSQ